MTEINNTMFTTLGWMTLIVFSSFELCTTTGCIWNYERQGLDVIPPVAEGCSPLKVDLSDNNIRYISSGDFQDFQRMKVLILSNNSITEIDKGAFQGAVTLEVIILSRNPLVIIRNDSFKHAVSVQTLDLSYCQLASIDGDLFGGELVLLVDLNLSHNDLYYIPKGTFDPLTSLQVIDLSHNNIEVLPDFLFKLNFALIRVDLNSNSLAQLPEDIFNGKNDKIVINLSGNPINDIKSTDLTTVSRVTYSTTTNQPNRNVEIELSHNQIKVKDDKEFSHNPNSVLIVVLSFSVIIHFVLAIFIMCYKFKQKKQQTSTPATSSPESVPMNVCEVDIG